MGSEIERLETSKTCEGADGSHAAVQDFYKERNDEMEEYINVIRGKFYSPAELAAYKEMKRQPVSINKALTPFRTVMGTIAQSGFDADFLPFEESDQPLAEILGKLALFESKRNEDDSQNAQMCQNAYIMGRGYRLHWVEQGGEAEPKIRSRVLNPFAVYFDPDSSDVISRKDAQFVDVAHWLSMDEIKAAFPDSENQINADQTDRLLRSDYEHYDKSANRKHEDGEELNGKHKVIERYYRVKRNGGEELWLAVWAPGLLADSRFLFNGRYHSQPIDPSTGKIIFPVVELVSDNIMGDSEGFVKFLKDPIKLVSTLYTQLVEGAKHSGTGYLIDESQFATPEEADRAKKMGAHANQRYKLKPGGNPNSAMVPIPGQAPPQINLQSLQHANAFIDEMSSAPKALQGVSESASTPAALNAQRIEQASTQLSVFFNYYKRYLQQTLKLRYAYWRESYTEQMTFRIAMPNGGQESATINQMVPETGFDNMPTGEIAKINDISAAEFDVVINDSFQSPTYMQKMTAELTELLQNPAFSQNPNIAMPMIEELFRMSKAPQGMKDKISQNMQMQAQMQQMQQMQPEQPPQQGAA